MILAPTPPVLLSSDDAIAWLAARGTTISRATLDRMRDRGEIHFYRAPKSRVKIRYAPADLAAHLPERVEHCPSNQKPAPAPLSGLPEGRIVAFGSRKARKSEFQAALDRARTLAR